MRVVHVAPRFPPAEGGGERHVARLTEELARRGHEVHVLTTKLLSEVPRRLDPALPDREERDGVRVERLAARPTGLPVWGYGFTCPGAPARVRALAPDVVHLHGYGYHTGDVLARTRKRAGAAWRLVMTSHGFVAGRGPLGPVKRLYDATRGAATVRALDAAIAIAPSDREDFLRLGARRCEVVPNGVDAARFAQARPDAALLRRLGLQEGAFLVSVARLERIKGQDLLLEAFARLAPARAGLGLCLVGEGAARPSLEARARSLGVEGRVAFAGRLDDPEVAALLRSAAAFAHTPREEPFGIAVLEAMAAGLPALATQVGGLPFAAGGAAHLVAPEAGAIAAGLERVLDDEALRKDLAARGRARAAALTWEANAARVEALYRDLARGAGGRGAP